MTKLSDIYGVGIGVDGITIEKDGAGNLRVKMPVGNVLFQWAGNKSKNIYRADGSGAPLSGSDGGKLTFGYVEGTSYETLFTSKFLKGIKISTVRVYAYIGAWFSASATCKVSIGATSVEVTSNSDAWVNGSIDVSGLTNGTVYDVTVELKSSDGGAARLFGIILFTE